MANEVEVIDGGVEVIDSGVTIIGGGVTIQDLMIEKNSKGEEKKVLNCTVDGGLYKAAAEAAGLDYKEVVKVNKFNGEYVHEVTERAVKAGVAMLEENKEADRVVFVAPYLNDDLTSKSSKINISVDRSKTIIIPNKGQEERPVFALDVVNKFEKVSSSSALAIELKALLQEKLA